MCKQISNTLGTEWIVLLAENDSIGIDENLMGIKLPLGGITMTTFAPDKVLKIIIELRQGTVFGQDLRLYQVINNRSQIFWCYRCLFTDHCSNRSVEKRKSR